MTQTEMVPTRNLYSVTTLIKEAMGKGDALVGWAAKVVAERAWNDHEILAAYVKAGKREEGLKWLKGARWEKTQKAQYRGKQLHTAAEYLALGKTVEEAGVAEIHLPWVFQFQRFLDDHAPEYLMAEAPVYNLTQMYAGTLDGVIRLPFTELGTLRVLMDVKTTDTGPNDVNESGRPKARHPFIEVALQCCAYSRAEYVGLDPARRNDGKAGRRVYTFDELTKTEPMMEVDGAICLVVSPVDYEIRTIAIDDEVWRSFLHCREVARYRLEISKRVIGPVVTTVREGVSAA
jgi:hypothetical protein